MSVNDDGLWGISGKGGERKKKCGEAGVMNCLYLLEDFFLPNPCRAISASPSPKSTKVAGSGTSAAGGGGGLMTGGVSVTMVVDESPPRHNTTQAMTPPTTAG